MTIEQTQEKLFNAIIYFVKNTSNCGITKLFKLLAYLDFIHFKQTGRSVTGLKYKALPMGPVPTKLYNELELMNSDWKEYFLIQKDDKDPQSQWHFKPRKSFNEKLFSKREMKILTELVFIFKDTLAKDIVKSSHERDTPWEKTRRKSAKNGEEIDYYSILEDADALVTVEQALEIARDEAEINEAFGGNG